MIPTDVLNSLKALALTQKPLITAASAISATSAFEPGQKFQAMVQAQVAPGIFKVQVGEQLLQLQLPGNIRSGDTINLQVVSLLPRLTFNMVASANPLSTADQLSATARLLSSLTQQPLQRSFVPTISNTPLWTGTTGFPDTAELAGKLHQALSQSGLFYESHQAQWLAGSRNTAQLMQEPQNQPADKVKAAFGLDANLARTNADAALNPGQPKISIPGVPDHLHPLIQQQLNALETRQVQWQGQIWPEQKMDWEIHEETAHAPSGDEGRQWVTQIHLSLPRMGDVTATLRFSQNGLTLTLDADQDATRVKLGSASSTLVAALSERGINTSSAVVTQHDKP